MIRTVAAAAGLLAVIAVSPSAHAEPFDPGDPDQVFAHFLARSGLLFNLPLEIYQGRRACEDYRRGESGLNVVYDLMRNGSYSFDVANGIVSVAELAYCTDVPLH